METVHQIARLRARVGRWRSAGQSVGLVPTMGNLHEGHLDLVRLARKRCDRVVVSVFVNPLQFGPNEDFDRYPRTLGEDTDKLAAADCDLLFAPSVAEMYPRGRAALTTVSVPGLAAILEGQFRPGFFDGVATVVCLLFNCVQPDLAVFGAKDYQQLQVIRRMVADLHVPIEIVEHPTRREADGLAMSSRNQYLSDPQRCLAPELYRSLDAIAAGIRGGDRRFRELADLEAERLRRAGFEPQYLEVRSPDLGEPDVQGKQWVILVAAVLGSTRLIDNLYLSI